ncbi:hypothetical protein H0H87_011611, partial [Tephrocybe sp. NHM501043]
MDISNDIFGRLKESDKKNGTTDESEARDYFMKFEHDEFVEMDGTTDVSFELPKGYRKFQGSGIAPSPSHEFQHHTRAHVRTVYAEVCRSIYELRDYATVVRALRDNVKGTFQYSYTTNIIADRMFLALWYLRKAGYVHRDVSAGNCLWGIASEKGKLSDLEYARPYDELSMHDPLT